MFGDAPNLPMHAGAAGMLGQIARMVLFKRIALSINLGGAAFDPIDDRPHEGAKAAQFSLIARHIWTAEREGPGHAGQPNIIDHRAEGQDRDGELFRAQGNFLNLAPIGRLPKACDWHYLASQCTAAAGRVICW